MLASFCRLTMPVLLPMTSESSMRWSWPCAESVENDISGLQKVIDDTSITWLQLETETEVLKEEPFMKKNHEKEVNGLQNQIANSGLTVELDAPKPQGNPGKNMADIQSSKTSGLRRTERS